MRCLCDLHVIYMHCTHGSCTGLRAACVYTLCAMVKDIGWSKIVSE